MTHMPNYCEDRLAPYTFESAVHMVQCWTNLRLRTRSPAKLAEIYFSMYPEERTPIWGVRNCLRTLREKCPALYATSKF